VSTKANSDDVKRLGRAVVFVHQHAHKIVDPGARAEVEVLLLTGRAMDFAARLRGHREFSGLTHQLVHKYAKYAGVGPLELTNTVLPALKAANILDYTLHTDGSTITHIEEYVGVSGTVTEQTVTLLEALQPTRVDLALLHSVEIGAMAPLGQSQHLQQLVARSYTDQEADDALRLARAVGLNLSVPSADLGEPVIFSPYVWGTKQLSLAKFLTNLPPGERDALLGMSEQVLSTPGLHIDKLSATPALIRSAQSVGLIQAATVQSVTGAGSTYVFSPLLETEDNGATTTEALHLRKLFVAHILFGHEKAAAGGGQIISPAVLVRALINRRRVGPATNIGTDYYLLEMAGVVAVDSSGSRPFLDLVKPEIAEAGLEWIERITDPSGTMAVSLAQSPTTFVKPEDARSADSDGASREILVSSILELRKEMQRATRRDDPWA